MREQLKRDKVLEPCLAGMEACGSAHYWARKLGELGHTVIQHLERKAGPTDTWLKRLLGRRNKNVAAVALANKNARIVRALLAHERNFQSHYRPALAVAA